MRKALFWSWINFSNFQVSPKFVVFIFFRFQKFILLQPMWTTAISSFLLFRGYNNVIYPNLQILYQGKFDLTFYIQEGVVKWFRLTIFKLLSSNTIFFLSYFVALTYVQFPGRVFCSFLTSLWLFMNLSVTQMFDLCFFTSSFV